MNKEKEIEEMVEIARKHGQKIYKETEMYADIYDDMTAVYEAGYRKADEVRKETAKEIFERVEKWLDEIVPNTREETLLICLLGWIKAKYDVYNDFDEVDE